MCECVLSLSLSKSLIALYSPFWFDNNKMMKCLCDHERKWGKWPKHYDIVLGSCWLFVQTYREQTDSCQRGKGLGGWVQKVKQNPPPNSTNSQTQTMVWLLDRKGMEEVEEGKGGVNGDGRRPDLGWQTHNTIYRWCIIELYTWNLYNSIKIVK